ncbi:alpha/beta hydrolase [Neorhizobium sp. P12A]|jgi:arylformamidase|uniref:alpha/beta hydrolase n=1 Tax=Neorhizobium sp. P12A TaxID=2268027 RepID=UPI0011ED9F42|nr:alpha/beta hydrolase [Neorhizobium sp. P12A]KAA0691950.1 alpha/beta hydrolase [Neorhizobium sp. P12A]
MPETDPFRTRDHVANFDSIVEEMVSRSAATRAALEMVADVRYGEGQGETLDLFLPPRPAAGMPVHIFIHGGYWRMFSKDDYSYVARTVTEAGAIAVIVDYALMPTVTMRTIVEQILRMRAWTESNIKQFGGDPRLTSVSGHSAGAHLAAFLFRGDAALPQIRSAFLLGGIYDLKPLQTSFLRKEIEITDDDVVAFSPISFTYDPSPKITIVVGDRETAPFHQQAEAFTALLVEQRLQAAKIALPESDHMSSVRDLGLPGTAASRLLLQTISKS